MLRDRVGDVERRRREGGAPFSEEQIAERVEQIRASAESPADAADAAQSTPDPELARRLDETDRLAERAKTYSRRDYPAIFGPEDQPRRPRRARWLGPIGRRYKDGR